MATTISARNVKGIKSKGTPSATSRERIENMQRALCRLNVGKGLPVLELLVWEGNVLGKPSAKTGERKYAWKQYFASVSIPGTSGNEQEAIDELCSDENRSAPFNWTFPKLPDEAKTDTDNPVRFRLKKPQTSGLSAAIIMGYFGQFTVPDSVTDDEIARILVECGLADKSEPANPSMQEQADEIESARMNVPATK